jgi:hypothetical protein
MDFEEIGSEIVDWIKLAQDRLGLVNMVTTCHNIHTANLIDNMHTKKEKTTCGIQGGTTLTPFRNIIKTKTPIAVARKAEQFLGISTHLMMAEQAETCSAMTNCKRI